MVGALSHIHGTSIIHTLSRSKFRTGLLSNRSMVTFMSSTGTTQSYSTSVNNDIEAYLKQSLPIRAPISVFEPMHHLTLTAPEITAPALCIAACELVGGSKEQAIVAASVIHIMHAASYAHQQLPLTGRSMPKTKRSFEPNIKLLTPDGMVPFGFELLAQMNEQSQANSKRILRVIVEITRAIGSQGMIEGEYSMSQYSKSSNEEAYHVSIIDKVCRKKEGKLHGCAAACGAILGGGSEEEIEKLRRYGEYAGMIQGILNLVEKDEKWGVLLKEVNKLRDLALNELKDFHGAKLEAISSFVEVNF